MDPDPLDPHYGRLAGSGSVWRDTDPDPGHTNLQNNAIAKEFSVNKLINVDFFHQVLKHFLKTIILHIYFLFESIAWNIGIRIRMEKIWEPGSGSVK